MHHEMDALEANLAATEEHLRTMAKCLQRERQAVVLFDLEDLIVTVHVKQETMNELERLTESRRSVCRQIWADVVGTSESVAEDMPTFLRVVAGRMSDRAPTWLRYADVLESLLATVRELQRANRSVVSRAARWVNRYLGQLTASDGRKYNAAGQMSTGSLSTLRRTI
jgi:flagellar biosynthesis/type III secretory pathway chaperone